MPITDITDLRDRLVYPTQTLQYIKNHVMIPFRWSSMWSQTGVPSSTGAIPASAALCTRSTAGALGQLNKSGSEQRAWLRNFTSAHISTGGVQQPVMLIDRLAHIGGLDGTSTGVQAINTPALARYTNGIGVVAAAEVYVAVGASLSDATLVYDSDSGVGHVASASLVDAGTNSFAARSMTVFPLQLGDRGVKAVTSVQLSASTGSVGNFGITLYKPLWIWPTRGGVGYSLAGDPLHGGGMPVIEDDACLAMIYQAGSGQAAVTICAEIGFLED